MTFLINTAIFLVVFIPIYLLVTNIKQKNYTGSLSESIDAMSGFSKSYNHYNVHALVIFILCVIYLITYKELI